MYLYVLLSRESAFQYCSRASRRFDRYPAA